LINKSSSSESPPNMLCLQRNSFSNVHSLMPYRTGVELHTQVFCPQFVNKKQTKGERVSLYSFAYMFFIGRIEKGGIQYSQSSGKFADTAVGGPPCLSIQCKTAYSACRSCWFSYISSSSNTASWSKRTVCFSPFGQAILLCWHWSFVWIFWVSTIHVQSLPRF